MGDIVAVAAAVQRLQRLRNSKRIHAVLTDAAGVVLTQQSLRLLIAVTDGETATELASSSNMDGAAVSRELRRLEEAGLVAREPSPHHHAGVVVRLTVEGRMARDRVVAVRHHHLARTFSGWSQTDTAALADLLGRFVDDLQANPLVPGE